MPVWPAYQRAAEVPAKRTGEIGEGLRSWIETEQEQQGEIEEVWDQTWGAGQRRTLFTLFLLFSLFFGRRKQMGGRRRVWRVRRDGESSRRLGREGKGWWGEQEDKGGRSAGGGGWGHNSEEGREARSDAMTVLTLRAALSYGLGLGIAYCLRFGSLFVYNTNSQKNVFKNVM